MAIIYSYPLADEVTNDSWVLGSEMDNGTRVVKNYSVGDIAAFIESQFTSVPTLQEVVSEGNTVSGSTIKVELGSYYTSLEGVSVNVSSSSNLLSLYANSVLFEKQFGTGSAELRFPNTINDARIIEFPDASGTIALTNDIPTPPYKVYTALLTQTGTSAPVAIVLENTLGGNVVWAYEGVGEYMGTLTGAFSNAKTYFSGLADQGVQLKVLRVNNNIVNVGTGISGVKTNEALNLTPIEIRVYN